jgi:hypothetical protein
VLAAVTLVLKDLTHRHRNGIPTNLYRLSSSGDLLSTSNTSQCYVPPIVSPIVPAMERYLVVVVAFVSCAGTIDSEPRAHSSVLSTITFLKGCDHRHRVDSSPPCKVCRAAVTAPPLVINRFCEFPKLSANKLDCQLYLSQVAARLMCRHTTTST